MTSTKLTNLRGPEGQRGPDGPKGDRGLPGVNAVPTDEAVATYARTRGTETYAAFVEQVGVVKALENVPCDGYGHSFLASASNLNPGPGADVGGHALERVALRCRTAPMRNLAQGGTRSDQMLASIIANHVPNTRGVIMIGGGHRNDQNFYTNATPNTATVAEVFRSVFAHLTARAILLATSSAMQYGAGWSFGVSDGTAGRYVDVAFSGDSVFIPFSAVTGAGGTFTVKRSNGTTVTTVATGGFGVAFTGVKKISGFGPGSHTVRLQVTTGTVALLGLIIPAATPPLIVWELEPRYNPAVVTGGALANTVNAAYQTATQAVLSDFDTSRIIVVTEPPTWDPVTDTTLDGVHPSAQGHGKIADWAIARMLEAGIDFMQGLNWLTGSDADPTTYTAPVVSYSRPGATAPAAPVLTATTGLSIDHTWAIPDDGGSTITGYRIEYSPNGTTGWTTKATYGPNEVADRITGGLVEGTTYYSRLVAVNLVGSTTSAVVSAVAGPAMAIYSKDTFARADSGSSGSTETGSFAWTAMPTGNQAKYTIAGGRLNVANPTTAPNLVLIDDGHADGRISATLRAAVSVTSGIAFRMNSAGTAGLIAARSSDGFYRIYTLSGTTYTSIAVSQSAIGAIDDVVTVDLSGSTIKLLVNGVPVVLMVSGSPAASVTSTVGQTATRHGLYSGGGTSTIGLFDDWQHTS